MEANIIGMTRNLIFEMRFSWSWPSSSEHKHLQLRRSNSFEYQFEEHANISTDQFSRRVLTVMIAGAVNDPSERSFLFLLVPLESRTKGSVNKVAVR